MHEQTGQCHEKPAHSACYLSSCGLGAREGRGGEVREEEGGEGRERKVRGGAGKEGKVRGGEEREGRHQPRDTLFSNKTVE